MNQEQFRLHVVRDALGAAGWWSLAVENLIVATAMVESGLEKLVQDRDGPARGVFQIEKVSYSSVLDYIKRDSEKVKTITMACNLIALPEEVDTVIWNLRYAVLITRMFYYRFPDPLPEAFNAQALYDYYSKHYNAGGKATVERDLPIFKKVCQYQEKS